MKNLAKKSRSVKKILGKVAISSLLMLVFPVVAFAGITIPTIQSVSNPTTYPGSLISITGSGFGDEDPGSYVQFTQGPIVASEDAVVWTNTHIVCIIPEGVNEGGLYICTPVKSSNKVDLELNQLRYAHPSGDIVITDLGNEITAFYENGSNKVATPVKRMEWFNWVVWNRLWIHDSANNKIEEYYIPRAYSDLEQDEVIMAKNGDIRIKRDYNDGKNPVYFSKDGLLIEVDGSDKVASMKYTTSIPNKKRGDIDYKTSYCDWDISTETLSHAVAAKTKKVVKSIYTSRRSSNRFVADFYYENTSFEVDRAEYKNSKGGVILSVARNADQTYTATHGSTGIVFEKIRFSQAGSCFLMMNSILRYIDDLKAAKEYLIDYYKFKQDIDVTGEIVMPNLIDREILSSDSLLYKLVRKSAGGNPEEANYFLHSSMRLFRALVKSAVGGFEFTLPDGAVAEFNLKGKLLSEEFSDGTLNEYFYNKNDEYIAYSHTDASGDTTVYQQDSGTFAHGGKVLADTVDGRIVFYVGYKDKGYETIHQAYNLAKAGSIIQLNAGTYSQGNLKIEKNITLRGDPAFERDQIIIDADNQTKRFAFIKKGDLSVENLTFKNFNYSGGVGGIFFVKTHNSNKSSLMVTKVDFVSNKARVGGSIYTEKSPLSVSNCTFTGNEAGTARGSLQYSSGGGAIASRGGIVTITNSDFINNTGKGGGYVGGAIDVKGGTLDISYSLFTGNKAARGAAIEIGGRHARASANITQCTFANNTPTIGSGGVINIARCRRWRKIRPGNRRFEYLNTGSTLNFTKSIIYGNEHNDITVEEYSDVTIQESVVQKNGIGPGDITDSSKQDDPMFYDAANSDYRIAKSATTQTAGVSWGSEGFYDEPAVPVDRLVWNITKDQYYDLIQEAIDDADPNNEIHVRGAQDGFDGMFNEQIRINKSLVLRGGYDNAFNDIARDHDATPTMIDAQYAGRVLTCEITGQDAHVIIDGFTLQNGSAMDGAGMLLTATDKAHILVEECKIKENIVDDHGMGGAGISVNADNSYVLFCSNEILDNSLNGYYGAGLHATMNNSAEVEVSDSVVSGNKIYGTAMDKQWNACGAGIAIQGDVTSKARIVNSLVVENSFEHCSDGRGIGIYAEAPIEIINSTIANNKLINTDKGNVKGGLYTESEFNLVNSIVYFTHGMQSWGGPNSYSYSDIEGWEAGFNGTISEDPRFVDMDNGDYRLLEDSPCIDAGDGDSATDTDLDQRERVDQIDVDDTGIGDPTYVDMGAYEFVGEATPPAPNPPASFRAEQIHSTPEGMNYGVEFNWDDEAEGEVRFYIESIYLGNPEGKLVSPNQETAESHYLSSFEEVPWTYRIKAEMPDGTYTEWSDLITVNYMYGPYPLTASSSTEGVISLEWLDRSATEQGYIIERSPDGDSATFVEISRMGAINGKDNTVTFEDAGLEVGTYYYRVYAYNETGVSNYSNVSSYTLEAVVPDPPANLKIEQLHSNTAGYKTVKLDWVDQTNGESGFEIVWTYKGHEYRADVNGANVETYTIFLLNYEECEMPFKIRAKMPTGEYSDWATGTVLLMEDPDTLTAISSSISAISLNWYDRTENEQGYVVERSLGSNTSTFVEIARIGASAGKGATVTYDDAGLDAGTYHYRVYAYNETGVSNYSNVDSCILEASSAPSGLSALQVPAVSDSLQHVELKWQDNAEGEIGYQVAYKNVSAGSSYSLYDVIQTPGLEFYHQILYTTSEYELDYKVRAKLPSGEYTDWSNETKVYLIARPEHLTARSRKRGCIEFTWKDRSKHEDGYRIERSTDGVNYEIIKETETIIGSHVYATYEDKNLTNGKYWYRISGFNSTGQSNYKIRAYVLTNGIPATGETVFNVQKKTYYSTIQSAINDADSGNTIRCMGKAAGFDGIFEENIFFSWKSLKLEGGYDYTFTNRDIEAMPSIIDGQSKGRALECMLPSHSLEIDGFTIQNGFIDGDKIAGDAVHGAGLLIKLSGSGSFTLSNSKVINNTAYNNWILYGAGVSISGYSTTSARITNSLIADNLHKKCEVANGSGLYTSSQITIINSTIANNKAEEVTWKNNGDVCMQSQQANILNSIIRSEQGIYLKRGGSIIGQYSNIEGYDKAGKDGNIDEDPLFTDPDNGDYHLALNSPCIDVARNGGDMGCF